jgi:hypothetical protein
MGKANFLFFINAYNDLCQSSTPALNNFKWSREINGVPYVVENSQQIQVPANSTPTSNLLISPSSFIYLESDQQVSVIYNGGTAVTLVPFQVNGLTQPAVFFIAGAATSITVTNSGTAAANVFFASMG